MNPEDYIGIPWKDNGDTADGADCRGLVMLWLREELQWQAPEVTSHGEGCLDAETVIREALALSSARDGVFKRGDVLFFRCNRTGLVRHVAVCLGGDRILNAMKGCGSRVIRGTRLIERCGMTLAGVLPPSDASTLAVALANPQLKDIGIYTALAIISIALSAASAFLQPKPKAGQFRAQTGRYGFDQLVTATSTQVPIPDLLGGVTIAGNSPYQQLIDNTIQELYELQSQKANKIVIVSAGPISSDSYNSSVMKINGVPFSSDSFHPGGIAANPAQNREEAVDGTIGSRSSQPSVSYYSGAWDIAVPLDVRAMYDRHFPIYGFNGCAYYVFRLIDSTKFQQFNMTATVKGRLCRTFTSAGFTTASSNSEILSGSCAHTTTAITLATNTFTTASPHGMENGQPVTINAATIPTGIVPGMTYYVINKGASTFQVAINADGALVSCSGGTTITFAASKYRFKLTYDDIVSVDAFTVGDTTPGAGDGTAQTEATASNQGPSNVYRLNKLKGYVELFTAAAAATNITISYTYYVRAWTQNPASHCVYLLTENGRGKGIPEADIDWTAATDMRDFCDATVEWTNANGTTNEVRYTSNYAVDVRKAIQDHLRPVLDAAYACMYNTGGKFVMKCRTSEAAVFDFDTTNILRDSFSSELQDRSQRANRVNLFYHSKDTYNAETAVMRENQKDQESREDTAGNEGRIEETLHMLAVDSENQGERIAEQILRENINCRWIVELKTTIKGLPLEPMDIVTVTHPSHPSWSLKEFRVEKITQDDKDIFTLQMSEYKVGCYI